MKGSAEWIHWFYFAQQKPIFYCFLQAVYQTIQQTTSGEGVYEIVVRLVASDF
jgi:hypothetical protein